MMPFYTIEWPKCNSLICWFCSKNLKNEIEFEYCCLRRLICLKIFKVHNEEIYRNFDSFNFNHLPAILPYLSLLCLILSFQWKLFYNKVNEIMANSGVRFIIAVICIYITNSLYFYKYFNDINYDINFTSI